MLQRAWQQGYADGTTAPPPTVQETLRTLGGLIDEAAARGAYLGLPRGGAQRQTFGRPGA